MFLESLKLSHYKNYEKLQLRFSRSLNFLTGANGMGKTNVLDAIYYSCLGKSHFSSRDIHVIRHEDDFFRIESLYQLQNGKKDLVAITYKRGSVKKITINDSKLKRQSEITGKYPVVMISTQDDKIILEGSLNRRKYLNNLLGQLDLVYYENLILYHRLLKQRNAVLKSDERTSSKKEYLIKHYSEQMHAPAEYIYNCRKDYLPKINQYFQKKYNAISDGKEEVSLIYSSKMKDIPFMELMKKNLTKDIMLRRTSFGIHRDDLEIKMGNVSFKEFGSQGQLKTCAIALKLAQFKLYIECQNRRPIILLDDVFDRLDPQRVKHLLKLLVSDDMGQVFVSDTEISRAEKLKMELNEDGRIFIVENGMIECKE